MMIAVASGQPRVGKSIGECEFVPWMLSIVLDGTTGADVHPIERVLISRDTPYGHGPAGRENPSFGIFPARAIMTAMASPQHIPRRHPKMRYTVKVFDACRSCPTGLLRTCR